MRTALWRSGFRMDTSKLGYLPFAILKQGKRLVFLFLCINLKDQNKSPLQLTIRYQKKIFETCLCGSQNCSQRGHFKQSVSSLFKAKPQIYTLYVPPTYLQISFLFFSNQCELLFAAKHWVHMLIEISASPGQFSNPVGLCG
jgi:hypothetical protein